MIFYVLCSRSQCCVQLTYETKESDVMARTHSADVGMGVLAEGEPGSVHLLNKSCDVAFY